MIRTSDLCPEAIRMLLESYPQLVDKTDDARLMPLLANAGVVIPDSGGVLTTEGQALVKRLRDDPEAWASLVTTNNRAVAVRFAASRPGCRAELGITAIEHEMCRRIVEVMDRRGDRRGL